MTHVLGRVGEGAEQRLAQFFEEHARHDLAGIRVCTFSPTRIVLQVLQQKSLHGRSEIRDAGLAASLLAISESVHIASDVQQEFVVAHAHFVFD